VNTFAIDLRKKETFDFWVDSTTYLSTNHYLFSLQESYPFKGVARSLARAARSRVLSRLVSIAINGQLVRKLLPF